MGILECLYTCMPQTRIDPEQFWNFLSKLLRSMDCPLVYRVTKVGRILMLERCGTDRGSVIADKMIFIFTFDWNLTYFCNIENTFVFLGKSTHNQRIERLWRDVLEGCLDLFYEIFMFVEHNGFLDVLHDVQMWCLHYVYIPILNKDLDAWRNAWIHHPLQLRGTNLLSSYGFMVLGMQCRWHPHITYR